MENITIVLNGEGNFELADNLLEKLKPKQLMLLALAECAGLTAVALLRKMQIGVSSFEIQASGELPGEPGMAYTTFTSFHLESRLVTQNPDDASRAGHALDLAHNKYCGVGEMYSRIAPVSVELIVNKQLIPVEI